MKRLLLTLVFVLMATPAFAQVYDRAKIWDGEINAFGEIDRKQTPPENAVLFVGSSSMRLWTNLRTDFPNLRVINRGFGGSRIEDSVHYFDRIVAPYKAKAIVLYAGENDINDGLAPEKVAADFVAFAKLVREKSPKSKLYFVSLKPSPSRWALRDKMMKTNELIRGEIAKMKNAAFVDVWTAMLGPNGEPKPEIFRADKLHMTEAGYEIWRGILAKFLK